MPKFLVVADEVWARNEVHAAVTEPDVELIDHDDPATAAETAVEHGVDVVIVDLQTRAMGGMAVTRAVRNATGSRETSGIPVVMLLDRSADEFLARRAGASAWVMKPFTSRELGSAIAAAISPSGSDLP
ncbi:MAG: response regulator [Acidimicrobiia bacterium]|nr:response regulator [Acidimicrobiia bacterium]